MDFRSPHLPRHEPAQGLLTNAAIAEEIFRQSLNTSYIGQMSGQKDVPHLEHEPLFNIPEEPPSTPAKRKRIDFSRFKGEAGIELRETVITDEDMQFMFVRSLTRDGKEIVPGGGCSGPCGEGEGRVKCLLELLNESSL